MNVTRPLSAYGSSASCWDLLKRWISSTNRMVCLPMARFCWACSIAARMSLTPENTADNAMNSHLKAVAVRRAKVVLPTPGGPQKIIECGFPDWNARRSGLPSPSKCDWPTTSSRVLGRRASARGATGSCANRSDMGGSRWTRGWPRPQALDQDEGEKRNGYNHGCGSRADKARHLA
ncbi:hypothetical protein D3C78_1255850 [compost metagenome]